MYFLDTNTCIYYLNGCYPAIRSKLLATSPYQIAIPAIVKAELLTGAYKSQTKDRTLEKLHYFLKPFAVIDFTDTMTTEYADIRSQLEIAGLTIGANDMFIASIARYHKATLVTHNVKEFQRVKNLKIEDWTK